MKKDSTDLGSANDAVRTRLVLLVVGLVLALGMAVLAVLQEGDITAPSRGGKDAATRWMDEVRQAASPSASACPGDLGDSAWADRLRHLDVLEASAQVVPAKNLDLARQAGELLACRGSGREPSTYEDLPRARDDAFERLERHLRLQVARLRRAQHQEDLALAARVVSEIEELLSGHEGPLRHDLAELRARYR